MAMILAILAAAAGCDLPVGWGAVDAQRAKFVVVGEQHGTVEAPAAFGEIACALTHRGERVLVALEQDARLDAAFQAAWVGDAKAFPAAFPAELRWTGRNDGNGSTAIHSLLVRLHGLRAGGARISVTAFNGARDAGQEARWAALPGQGGHEAAQAENIATAAAADAYDRVLVLVGNAHASRRPQAFRGVAFEPMAMRLARDHRIVALRVAMPAGTGWNCRLKPDVRPGPDRPITSADVACGAHAVADETAGRAPGVHLGAFDDGSERYDGVLVLASSTASPPHLPAAAR